MFFELNRLVDWLVEADVSENRAVSIFTAHFSPEDGESTLLRNVDFYQPTQMAI
jgi:hypothetical protein